LYLNSNDEVINLESLVKIYFSSKYNVNDFKWIFDNDSIIFHTLKEIFHITINEKTGDLMTPKKIDISIEHQNLIIFEVIPSPVTDRITIAFKETLTSKETLLITWNTQKNEEISNLSTEENYFIIHGKNT